MIRSKFQIELTAIMGVATIGRGANQGLLSKGQFLKRTTLNGIVVFSLYKALLTTLKTETLRKKGALSRSEQVQVISSEVLKSTRDSATTTFTIGVLVLVFPWLYIPFSILGVVGIGKASVELFNSFWNSLEFIQRVELLRASKQAGINLRRFIKGDELDHRIS